MRELTKYIIKQLVIGLVIVTVCLLAIVWLTQSLRFMELILSRGLSITVFIRLTMLLIPNFIVIILPIALFGVTLFTYNRMLIDREIVVMYSAGVSQAELSRPVLILGSIITIICWFLTISYVPESILRFRELQWSIRHDVSHLLFQEGEFVNVSKGITIYIKKRINDGSLEGIMVHDQRKENSSITMMAEKGMIVYSKEGPSITMVNGSRQEVKGEEGRFSLMYFDSYTMDLGLLDEGEEIRFRDAKERGLFELLTINQDSGISANDIKKFRVEGHHRIVSPLYNLAFALIAVTGLLCSKFDRRGQSYEIMITIVIMLFFLTASLGFENISAKNLIFIPIMYINAIVPIFASAWFLTKFETGKKFRKLITVFFIMLAITGNANPVFAASITNKIKEGKDLLDEAPVKFYADELVHDKVHNYVSAKGHVEFNIENNILKADSVNYSLQEDTVKAAGNIVLVQADGNVVFADFLELTGDLKNGYVNNIKVIMADKARLAAGKIRREDGNKNYMENGVFSPCDLCEDYPKKQPVWQIKAKRVFHDEANKKIAYRDAVIELGGVPVAYTPYFSHYEPSVKRKSGFLAPKVGGRKDLGATLETPYFIAISPSEDVTISPIYTSDQNGILSLEHRKIYDTAESNFFGSITKDKEEKSRGNINFNMRKEINDTYVSEVNIERSTDDTYLKKYGFDTDSSSWLETRAKVEGFDDRDYLGSSVISFQDLREEINNDSTPVVVEPINVSFFEEPDSYGAYKTFKANTLLVDRKEGSKSRRVSATAGWNLPYASPYGDIYMLSASVRGDGYNVEDVTLSDGSEFNGTVGRLHPKLSLKWSYPFAKREEASYQVIEPVLVGIVSPSNGNKDKIPNEDSRDLELDDTNVLDTNHFTGYDSLETGQRVNYGVKWSAYGEKTGRAEVFMGQSYRFSEQSIFPEESGLNSYFSDYVGRIQAAPNEYLDLMYRFRLDQTNLEARRNEVSVEAGSPALKLGMDYMFINASSSKFGNLEDRKELSTRLKSAITKFWSTEFYQLRDLTADGGPINYGGNLVYEDECFKFDTSLKRTFTTDRDYSGGYSFVMTLVFKPLGRVHTGGGIF